MKHNNLKLLIVAGARPNFMKVAPLIKAIQSHNQVNGGRKLEYRMVHTGQHYDSRMSDVFFAELGIPAPDVNLQVGSGSHAKQTANIMLAFEPVCEANPPDWLVVVGDVNSTMACTLVASKLGIRVAHIEAGLRSFDRSMPEEINRLVTDAVADLLLTPSEDADENLLREGVPPGKIERIGNIMIDALMENLPQARKSPILSALGLEPGRFIYVTLHRPQNVDNRESLMMIMEELKKLAVQHPVIFPMHPRTRKMLSDFAIESNGVAGFKVVEPVGYNDSLCLTENARLVLTDSGGLQEESTFFRTPCLTLRPNTERPITIKMGSNRLTSLNRLGEDVLASLKGRPRCGEVPPLWDGKTASRVVDCLIKHSV